MKFFQDWNSQSLEAMASDANNEIGQFLTKLRVDPKYYHEVCTEAEQGDPKKMRKLLKAKKLFCIPWLLAGDIILVNYPDKYDSQEYKDHIRKL